MSRPEIDIAWMERGACVGVPTALFFPDEAPEDGIKTSEDAEDTLVDFVWRSYCSTCPVQATCLTHALAVEKFGIWAGTTSRCRRLLRRRRTKPGVFLRWKAATGRKSAA